MDKHTKRFPTAPVFAQQLAATMKLTNYVWRMPELVKPYLSSLLHFTAAPISALLIVWIEISYI